MRYSILLAGLLALTSVAAQAQSAAIAERKTIFKSWGAAAGGAGKMMRGEEAFNLAFVQASLKLLSDTSKIVTLFPADSKEGGETKALANIWTDNAKFLAIFGKLSNDAKAAAVSIKDEASFKSEWPKVAGNCGTCHTEFRAR
jgi:cytochrome c556